MTDGEKKAIKDCDTIFICLEDMMSEESANDYRKSYLTLTNLIEKQSKEIEELKEINNETVTQTYIRCSKKFKDKIKAKIEELEKYRDKFDELNMLQDVIIKQNQIQVLQSLLEKE